MHLCKVDREASRGKDRDRERAKEVEIFMRPTSGRGFYDPQSEMKRLFDEMFGGGLSSRRSGGQQRGQGAQSGHRRSTWSRRTTTLW